MTQGARRQMTPDQNVPMQCYDCALVGENEPAVGACRGCGGGLCADHAVRANVPRYVQSSGGIGGPYVRAPRDRHVLLCAQCAEDPDLLEGL